MFDDAGHLGESARESARIVDRPETGVENEVSLIRDENMAVRLVTKTQRAVAAAGLGGGRDGAGGGAEPEVDHLDGQRKAAKAADLLRFVGDHDHVAGSVGHARFAQHRAAPALDEVQRGIELVCAVDGKIELGLAVERSKRNAETFGLRLGGLRRGYAHDLQAVLNLLSQKIDEMRRRGAAAKAEPHTWAHELERAARRLALQRFEIDLLGRGAHPGSSVHLTPPSW